MARSKSDISNSAIRIFLQKVGEFYDKERGFEKFVPKRHQSLEILKYFGNKCCYCNEVINIKNFSQDHLIPMNKDNLGLHAWGNVVPCCTPCNNEKQQKRWLEFLKYKTDKKSFASKRNKILKFIKFKKYDPSLNLDKTVGNLYQDVGEVAMALINLRYRQAEELIIKIIESK